MRFSTVVTPQLPSSALSPQTAGPAESPHRRDTEQDRPQPPPSSRLGLRGTRPPPPEPRGRCPTPEPPAASPGGRLPAPPPSPARLPGDGPDGAAPLRASRTLRGGRGRGSPTALPLGPGPRRPRSSPPTFWPCHTHTGPCHTGPYRAIPGRAARTCRCRPCGPGPPLPMAAVRALRRQCLLPGPLGRGPAGIAGRRQRSARLGSERRGWARRGRRGAEPGGPGARAGAKGRSAACRHPATGTGTGGRCRCSPPAPPAPSVLERLVPAPPLLAPVGRCYQSESGEHPERAPVPPSETRHRTDGRMDGQTAGPPPAAPPKNSRTPASR